MGMLKEGVRLDRVRGGRQKYRRMLSASSAANDAASPGRFSHFDSGGGGGGGGGGQLRRKLSIEGECLIVALEYEMQGLYFHHQYHVNVNAISHLGSDKQELPPKNWGRNERSFCAVHA